MSYLVPRSSIGVSLSERRGRGSVDWVDTRRVSSVGIAGCEGILIVVSGLTREEGQSSQIGRQHPVHRSRERTSLKRERENAP
jgi:hypothetical protein